MAKDRKKQTRLITVPLAFLIGLFSVFSGFSLYKTIKEGMLENSKSALKQIFVKLPVQSTFVPLLLPTIFASLYNLIMAAFISIPYFLLEKPFIEVMLENKSLKESFFSDNFNTEDSKKDFYQYYIETEAQSVFLLVLSISLIALTSLAFPAVLPLATIFSVKSALIISSCYLVGVQLISGVVAAVKSLRTQPAPTKQLILSNHQSAVEQQEKRNQLIESLKQPLNFGNNRVATLTLDNHYSKLMTYELDFKIRYLDPNPNDSDYLRFNSDIVQAKDYLNALRGPSMDLDTAVEKDAPLQEIKAKAKQLLLRCSPDHHMNKGLLVETLSHEFMKTMLSYKHKLMTGLDDFDYLGVKDFKRRYNEMAEQVENIIEIRKTLWKEERAEQPLSTSIVPTFDVQKIMDLKSEFENHVRSTYQEHHLSFNEAEDTIAIFGFYCVVLRESLKVSLEEIRVLTDLSKARAEADSAVVKAQEAVHKAELAEAQLEQAKELLNATKRELAKHQDTQRKRAIEMITSHPHTTHGVTFKGYRDDNEAPKIESLTTPKLDSNNLTQ